MKEVKKEYEKLKKKFNLPPLKELIREFGVKLESPDSILRDIIEKMKEEMSKHAETLESTIFVRSSSNPSLLYQARMINKEEAFQLYKKLMSMKWKGEKAKLTSEDRVMASFIIETFDEWKKLKKDFIRICESFEKKWKDVKLGETSSGLAYHG